MALSDENTGLIMPVQPSGGGFGGRDKESSERGPVQPQPKPKIETGVERKRTGNTRVVDTRTGSSSVDLSKYDEKFDNMAGEQAQNMQRQGKEKIGGKNRNKQRQQQQAASSKRRQEERDKIAAYMNGGFFYE